MFSHYKYYDEVFDKLMGDEFQMNMRECWVRMFDTWVPYPFQNNIRHLPKEVTYECLAGLVEAQTKRDHKKRSNFEEFIDAVFGDGIARHFMKPYNFKVWAHPPKMMNKEWIGERVAVLDINRAIKNVVMQSDDFGWGPNNQFKFPLIGGTGEFYRRFAKPLEGHVHLNKPVDFINLLKKEIRFADGEIQKYDELISTVPLDKLCNDMLNGEVPRANQEARRHRFAIPAATWWASASNSHARRPRAGCTSRKAIARSTASTYLSNYSPYMTPDNGTHYSLLCETSYSEFKPVDGSRIIDDTIDGLVNAGLITDEDRKDIVDTWVIRRQVQLSHADGGARCHSRRGHSLSSSIMASIAAVDLECGNMKFPIPTTLSCKASNW